MGDVFHLGLTKAMLAGATLAIIPGDPERVARIAELMDKAMPLAKHREFTSYLAYIGNKAVVICSTGIGGPSTPPQPLRTPSRYSSSHVHALLVWQLPWPLWLRLAAPRASAFWCKAARFLSVSQNRGLYTWTKRAR